MPKIRANNNNEMSTGGNRIYIGVLQLQYTAYTFTGIVKVTASQLQTAEQSEQ